MNLGDLNNLDLRDIANAPMPVKIVLLVVLFALLLTAGWFLVWSEGLRALDSARAQEQTLRETYTSRKIQAYHYDAYKRRLQEIEQALAAMLRQLPDRSQMDALLTDINQVGVAQGLEFELFRPGAEAPADFYATLPVSIRVIGTYHDIGRFVSDLAQLPRIVTLHDMVLTPVKDGVLTMDARIQTYRYLDEAELAAARAQKGGR